MTEKETFIELFKKRTKKMAVDIIFLFRKFPKTDEARICGKQLIRCATSVAANYRAACRARSQAEFYSKLSITIEECDETLFWLELIEESGIYKDTAVDKLKKESTEIVMVLFKARKTASK